MEETLNQTVIDETTLAEAIAKLADANDSKREDSLGFQWDDDCCESDCAE